MKLNKTKALGKLVIQIVIISLSLFAIHRSILFFITRNNDTDHCASMFAMLILICIGLLLCTKQKIELSVFPKRFSVPYIVVSVIALLLLVFNPSNFRGDVKPIIMLIYGSIVTPVFEELIFRGYVWNQLNLIFQQEWITYLLSTVLFGFWHLGYVYSISFRIKSGLLNAMIWKVITGLCYGLILGLVRKKTKNCYSTMLLHGVMNIFGR